MRILCTFPFHLDYSHIAHTNHIYLLEIQGLQWSDDNNLSTVLENDVVAVVLLDDAASNFMFLIVNVRISELAFSNSFFEDEQIT